MALRRVGVFILLVYLLAACGWGTPDNAIPDNIPTSEAPATSMVVSSSGPSLPLGRLLFVKQGNIWMFEGSNIRRLTASGKTVQPSWAPNSDEFAYVQREESYSDIYIRSLEEKGRGTQLTSNEPTGLAARSREHVSSVRWGFYPAWSPDGKLLAYVSQRYTPRCADGTDSCPVLQEYPLSLYLYRPSQIEAGIPPSPEGNIVVVKQDTDIHHPAWSPDGRYIAFTESKRYPAEDEIGTTIGFYDVESGEVFQISGIPDGAHDPAWSPDGKWLTFARHSDAGVDVWAAAANLDSRAAVTPFQLSYAGNIRAPTWSPDGAYLAFLQLADGSIDLRIAPVAIGIDGRPQMGEPETLLENETLDADSGFSWAR